MPEETYEEDIQPIPGDVFLDRILGWLSFICGLAILGVAVFRLIHPDPKLALPVFVEPARILLILVGLAGILAIIRSTRSGFRFALIAFAIRVVGALALYPWSGGPRFSGSEILFDFVGIGYCLLGLKREDQPD